MSIRSNFLKSELEKIYSNLNMSYEYTDHSRLENDNKFIKILEGILNFQNPGHSFLSKGRGKEVSRFKQCLENHSSLTNTFSAKRAV